jgi:hypothetical protein
VPGREAARVFESTHSIWSLSDDKPLDQWKLYVAQGMVPADLKKEERLGTSRHDGRGKSGGGDLWQTDVLDNPGRSTCISC